uniref:dolichyl-phosphate beta-glucosyltransferase n=1 Tax=Globisporangium ultimum (strain ATCC 200006 / CBS 805.95 / DAOM BR144) TaxID=431595 RepID=K3WZN8_GLOUD
MEAQLVHAAVLLLLVPLGAGALLLLHWMREPFVEAQRLAKEVDPAQENAFEDPNDPNAATRMHAFGSLGDESATRSLSVILPAFNEQDRILVTIRDTIAYLEERKAADPTFTYEVIVVDDCSQDKTVDVVLEQVKMHTVERIRLLRLQKNHGKGGAVRKGMLRARGAKILFADADNATEISEYAKLEREMLKEHEKSDTRGVVVCGSRAHLEEEAIAKRHPIRNLLMHGFHMIVSTLCVKNVRDTQCGFKLFDRTAARIVFAPMHIERWAFDVELLYIAAAQKLSVKEVAVQWREIPGSKLSVVSATITMLREIILIAFCYTFGVWRLDDGGFRLARQTQQ